MWRFDWYVLGRWGKTGRKRETTNALQFVMNGFLVFPPKEVTWRQLTAFTLRNRKHQALRPGN